MRAFDRVTAARAADRLTASDFIKALFGDTFFFFYFDIRYAHDKVI